MNRTLYHPPSSSVAPAQRHTLDTATDLSVWLEDTLHAMAGELARSLSPTYVEDDAALLALVYGLLRARAAIRDALDRVEAGR